MLVPMIAMMILMGVYPKPFLSTMETSVRVAVGRATATTRVVHARFEYDRRDRSDARAPLAGASGSDR